MERVVCICLHSRAIGIDCCVGCQFGSVGSGWCTAASAAQAEEYYANDDS